MVRVGNPPRTIHTPAAILSGSPACILRPILVRRLAARVSRASGLRDLPDAARVESEQPVHFHLGVAQAYWQQMDPAGPSQPDVSAGSPEGAERIVAVHDEQLTIHGGASGLRDEGMLESALDRPKNRWSYEQAELATRCCTVAVRLSTIT